MKRIIASTLFAAAITATASADEFKLTVNEMNDLAANLAALDGYQHSVDQGPGNPAKVVDHEPYKFAAAVRAKLAADRAELMKVLRETETKVEAIRLSISGDANKIDDKDPAQLKAWKAATKFLDDPVPVNLSPIASDELTSNDNPVPVSVLSVLYRLRAIPK